MKFQRCYGGVRLLNGIGPSIQNISKLDMGAMPMVKAMASRGLRVDLAHFTKMEKILIDDLDRITEDVKGIAGRYINLASGPQVSEFLFKDLGLKQARPKFVPTGDRESVENDVLVAIQHEHPAVAKILEYKKLDKLRGTYVEPMPRYAKRTAFGQWRIFPKFKTTRIPSGRFAAEKPNLLAMPNRTERGRQLCEGFITDPGHKFLSCDLSQIEPRTVAHRSQDPALMNVYLNQEDIYSDFAITAFGLPDTRYRDAEGWHYPGVHKKDHRFPSKTCILASIYRVTAKGLLEQLPAICVHCNTESAKHDSKVCGRFEAKWNEENCQQLINAFYLKYRGIGKMQQADDSRVRRHAMTWDDFGRLQHVTAVRSVHSWVVSAALRESGNTPIQGTATAIFKLGMARIQDELTAAGMYGDVWWPLLPIHDEIVSEVREDMAEEIGEYIAQTFRETVRLRVPIDAEWAVSDTWGSLIK